MAGIEKEGGTSNEEHMDRMDRRSAAQSGPLSRGGIDPAGRLVGRFASLALSPPDDRAKSKSGADMSARFGLLAGLFLAILFTAGCASVSGLSTQASLQNADAVAAEKTRAGTATFGGGWPASH